MYVFQMFINVLINENNIYKYFSRYILGNILVLSEKKYLKKYSLYLLISLHSVMKDLISYALKYYQ